MTSFGSKIAQENSRENAQNIRIKNEIDTYYFHQFWTCENITNQPKTYQEYIVNFFGIFARNLACIWVQIARKKVQLATKFKKSQKALKPMDLRPKPTDLMDPDQANAAGALDWSRSIKIWIKRPVKRENGPGFGSTRPSVCIKGLGTRIPSFLSFFLFLPSSPSSPRTLNPNYPKSVQIHARSSLIALSCCSMHQSNIQSFETHEIGVILVAVVNRSDSSFFAFLALNFRGSSRIRNGFHSLWIFEASHVFYVF